MNFNSNNYANYNKENSDYNDYSNKGYNYSSGFSNDDYNIYKERKNINANSLNNVNTRNSGNNLRHYDNKLSYYEDSGKPGHDIAKLNKEYSSFGNNENNIYFENKNNRIDSESCEDRNKINQENRKEYYPRYNESIKEKEDNYNKNNEKTIYIEPENRYKRKENRYDREIDRYRDRYEDKNETLNSRLYSNDKVDDYVSKDKTDKCYDNDINNKYHRHNKDSQTNSYFEAMNKTSNKYAYKNNNINERSLKIESEYNDHSYNEKEVLEKEIKTLNSTVRQLALTEEKLREQVIKKDKIIIEIERENKDHENALVRLKRLNLDKESLIEDLKIKNSEAHINLRSLNDKVRNKRITIKKKYIYTYYYIISYYNTLLLQYYNHVIIYSLTKNQMKLRTSLILIKIK